MIEPRPRIIVLLRQEMRGNSVVASPVKRLSVLSFSSR
jgi:hypothetical protein